MKEAIGEVPFPIHQGPFIIASEGGPTTWSRKLAHPSPGAVSVFRDLSKDSESCVSFTLYIEGCSGTETAVVRKLKPAEILFVKGGVSMDVAIPSGGSFVFQGHSGNSMGLDMLSPKAFPFMSS